MKYLIIVTSIVIIFFPQIAKADMDEIDNPPDDSYLIGTVNTIEQDNGIQKLEVKLNDEKVITAFHEPIFGSLFFPKIQIDDNVIIQKSSFNYYEFTIYDHYRIPQLVVMILLLIFITIILLGKKGLFSIVALLGNLLFIINYTIPSISTGKNIILIGVISSLFILTTSTIASHGMNKNSIISLSSSIITLFATILISILIIPSFYLQGTGTTEGFLLATNNLSYINLSQLIVVTIIIGISGLLDDVTIIQAITVENIAKTNNKLEINELFRKGIEIGKEHVVSMLNTLFIMYFSLLIPVFLYYSYSQGNIVPFNIYLNEETIILEIVRSIIGSISLMLAIPISAYIAAIFYANKQKT